MLLSVIVPVYKVERYLESCVDSILSQTYNEIEIILVDDGSPDSSGIICDRLEGLYEKVRVIHKENGGLSSARNAGVSVSNGEYVTFIDSDDVYGDERTLEIAMSYLINDASLDIVQFPLQFTSADGELIEPFIGYENTTYEEPRELVNQLANWLKSSKANLNSSACNKLFHRRLFESHKFNDIYCEDVDFLTRILDLKPKVLVQDKGKYIYYQRDNSIIHSKRSLTKLQDIVKLFSLLYAALQKFSDRYDNHAHCLLVIESTLQEIYRNYGYDNWKQSVKECSKLRIGKVSGDLKQKLKLNLMSILGLKNFSNVACFINYTLLKR